MLSVNWCGVFIAWIGKKLGEVYKRVKQICVSDELNVLLTFGGYGVLSTPFRKINRRVR